MAGATGVGGTVDEFITLTIINGRKLQTNRAASAAHFAFDKRRTLRASRMPLWKMRGEERGGGGRGGEGPSEVWMLAAGPSVAALAGRQVAASASFVSLAPLLLTESRCAR